MLFLPFKLKKTAGMFFVNQLKKKKDNWRAVQCRKAPSLNNLMQFTVSSDENFKVDKKTVFVSYDDFLGLYVKARYSPLRNDAY